MFPARDSRRNQVTSCQRSLYHDHEFALCVLQHSRAVEEGEDLMSDQMDGSWSKRQEFTVGRTLAFWLQEAECFATCV